MNESRVTVQRELQAAGRYLLANELAWGNAGNLSARLGSRYTARHRQRHAPGRTGRR